MFYIGLIIAVVSLILSILCINLLGKFTRWEKALQSALNFYNSSSKTFLINSLCLP
jgi:uncharacterized membrane protein YqhA